MESKKQQEHDYLNKDLPVGLSVSDVSKSLGISLAQTYVLFREPSFPCIVVGSRKLIIMQDYLEWLRQNKGGGDVLKKYVNNK